MTVHYVNVGEEFVIDPETTTVNRGDVVVFQNPGSFHVTVDLPNDFFGDQPHVTIEPHQENAATVSPAAPTGDKEYNVFWSSNGPGLGDGKKSGHIKVED